MKLNNYVSLEEKSRIFSNRHLIINTLSDFQNWYNVITDKKESKKLFRGVHEAKFKNYTSAQRKYITENLVNHGIALEDLIKAQLDKLEGVTSIHGDKEYKNLLTRYYKSLGVIPNDLLFLSFAQHYGGISPLLDFSRNVAIALFFMIKDIKFPSMGGEDIENYASIYYYPVDQYQQKITTEKFQDEYIAAQFSFEKLIDESPRAFTDKQFTVTSDSDPSIKTILSFSNFNIIRQEGGFVFYYPKGNDLKPFEHNDLHCIDIHKSLASHINYLLKDKNFTESYIFPKEKDMVKFSLDKRTSVSENE